MTEGEVVEQLVEFTTIVLFGVSVFFTVVSAYVAALYYFVHRAGFLGKAALFLFASFVLAVLIAIMKGAAQLHDGLIARLREIEGQGGLTAAGRAALVNSDLGAVVIQGVTLSVDQAIVQALWLGLGLTYLALAYLAFLHRWSD